ncbi:MAG: type III pantothenate kinase [Chloroflexota bacterium]
MLLAIDIGNTNVKVGVFQGEDLLATWRLATDARKTADEYGVLLWALFDQRGLRHQAVNGVCMSSTVPALTTIFRDIGRRYFGREPIVTGPDVNTGIVIATDNPREVGPDRIVNALAVSRRYRLPAVSIDIGTATNFDVVSEHGELLGCVIAPGPATAMEGLVARAARLFTVELEAPPFVIGKNTVHSVRAGVVYGYVGLVEGLVARIARELGAEPFVVATGGLAGVVVQHTDIVHVAEPALTLHGLRYLYELNAPVGGAAGAASARA